MNCPLCQGEVQEVESETLRHFVKDEYLAKVEDDNYFACLSEDCNLVYFNQKGDLFYKEDLKYPIWFKKDANPKYICYCNRVTEEDIVKAILEDKASNMKDIIRLTGAMKNANCKLNNPLGKCCGPNIEKIIKENLR